MPPRRPLRRVGSALLRAQTDEGLVGLARDGHEPAFSAIVTRHRAELERYCAGIVGTSRSEDAVQQAFINAHSALMDDDRPIALRAWLYRIARNVSLNILRTDQVETAVGTVPEASASTVAEVVLLRERLQETFAALEALPQRQRDALVLRELEGRSHIEIAEALGVTAGSARQHLARARTALRTAVTAVTPYPVMTLLGSTVGGPSVVALGAAGGITFSKLGVGVAVTAVLVGGGTLGSRPFADDDRPGSSRAPATRTSEARTPAPPERSSVPAAALPVVAAAPFPRSPSREAAEPVADRDGEGRSSRGPDREDDRSSAPDDRPETGDEDRTSRPAQRTPSTGSPPQEPDDTAVTATAERDLEDADDDGLGSQEGRSPADDPNEDAAERES